VQPLPFAGQRAGASGFTFATPQLVPLSHPRQLWQSSPRATTAGPFPPPLELAPTAPLPSQSTSSFAVGGHDLHAAAHFSTGTRWEAYPMPPPPPQQQQQHDQQGGWATRNRSRSDAVAGSWSVPFHLRPAVVDSPRAQGQWYPPSPPPQQPQQPVAHELGGQHSARSSRHSTVTSRRESFADAPVAPMNAQFLHPLQPKRERLYSSRTSPYSSPRSSHDATPAPFQEQLKSPLFTHALGFGAGESAPPTQLGYDDATALSPGSMSSWGTHESARRPVKALLHPMSYRSGPPQASTSLERVPSFGSASYASSRDSGSTFAAGGDYNGFGEPMMRDRAMSGGGGIPPHAQQTAPQSPRLAASLASHLGSPGRPLERQSLPLNWEGCAPSDFQPSSPGRPRNGSSQPPHAASLDGSLDAGTGAVRHARAGSSVSAQHFSPRG